MVDAVIFECHLDDFEQRVIAARTRCRCWSISGPTGVHLPCGAPQLARVLNDLQGACTSRRSRWTRENMKLAGRFRLRGFPTVMLFRDGHELGRFAGARAAHWIAHWIDEAPWRARVVSAGPTQSVGSQSRGCRNTSYSSASGLSGCGCQSYRQLTSGGSDIRIDSGAPARLQPEDRAAVVHQVELDITAAPVQLELPFALAERRGASALHDRQIRGDYSGRRRCA